MTQDAIAVGIDLGGTKIEVAVVRSVGGAVGVASRERVLTRREEGYEAILERVASLVRETCAREKLPLETTPIGIGMPGGVERVSGFVKNSNTTCLNGRPFRADLERLVGRAIAFENDANCFALAEATLGAARAHRQGLVFGVILGTGVGGGLVVSGRIWSGLHGIAGEWGHHAVSSAADARLCYCGNRGCLEAYASGPAVERRYELLSGERRPLADIAARRGVDVNASTAIEELLDAFGRGLANVIDIVDPTAIVLGGGVSNLDFLYEEGRARVVRNVFNDELLTPVLRNELGDSAGVIGAGLLALGTS